MARLDTGCFVNFPGFSKIDIGMELPRYPSSLLYHYLNEKNSFKFDKFSQIERVKRLASLGVLINDPKVNQFMVTRGMYQLIRESNKEIKLFLSEIKDENFVKLLKKRIDEGVKVSIVTQSLDKASAKILYPLFFKKNEVSFNTFLEMLADKAVDWEHKTNSVSLVIQSKRLDSVNESPVYFHSNIIISDNRKVLVGTAYPWINMSYNRILPDGPSFESAFIAEGKLAKRIIESIDNFSKFVISSTFTPPKNRNFLKKNLPNSVFEQEFEFI